MNAENYFNVGKIYQQAGRIDAAHTFLQKCVAIDKKNAKAHAAIGYILYQSKQFNEAKREIDLAISLSPDTYSCYYYQGKILKEAKDLAGAIKAFEKAQRDNEFKQKALIERSTCYIMANRYDNAQVDLQRAIDLDKENVKQETLHARYFLASCYEKTRKIEKAIEQWEAIYKRNRSFRDVPSKLSEYKALQANDNMKDYLTCADADFQKLYQENDDIFNKANAIVDKHFGTKLTEEYADNAGYVRHAFNKEQFQKYKDLGFVNKYGQLKTKGNTKILGDRLYNMSAREANNMFKETISKNLDSL